MSPGTFGDVAERICSNAGDIRGVTLQEISPERKQRSVVLAFASGYPRIA